jgi:hypothetical protein
MPGGLELLGSLGQDGSGHPVEVGFGYRASAGVRHETVELGMRDHAALARGERQEVARRIAGPRLIPSEGTGLV